MFLYHQFNQVVIIISNKSSVIHANYDLLYRIFFIKCLINKAVYLDNRNMIAITQPKEHTQTITKFHVGKLCKEL